MKSEEDEAFDELARKQGAWGGGFKAKQAMAADKLQEPVCDKDPQGCWNVRCQLGKQSKNLAQPVQEPVAWMHVQGNYKEPSFRELADDEVKRGWEQYPLYTTPPQREWVGLTAEDFSAIKFPAEMRFPAEFRAGARWAEVKLKEKNA